jgi:polyphosphate kinase
VQRTFCSAIIHQHISDLFRVCDRLSSISSTRNADLTVSEDVEDLAIALKGELSSTTFWPSSSFGSRKKCPEEIANYLLEQFDLDAEHILRRWPR